EALLEEGAGGQGAQGLDARKGLHAGGAGRILHHLTHRRHRRGSGLGDPQVDEPFAPRGRAHDPRTQRRQQGQRPFIELGVTVHPVCDRPLGGRRGGRTWSLEQAVIIPE
ncbi:MAG: hypothetical protein ACK56I_28990, partial [bacterium]